PDHASKLGQYAQTHARLDSQTRARATTWSTLPQPVVSAGAVLSSRRPNLIMTALGAYLPRSRTSHPRCSGNGRPHSWRACRNSRVTTFQRTFSHGRSDRVCLYWTLRPRPFFGP